MANRACLGGIAIGDGLPVQVAGVLNVSPESFYQGSVVLQEDRLLRAGEAMTRAGAAFIDVGAMSTAPYLATRITEAQEAERLAWVVDLLVRKLDCPVSADTSRSGPARAALDAGARIINDVTGLTGDREMGVIVARARTGLILMAGERGGAPSENAIDQVGGLLRQSLALAREAGIEPALIAVDPGIGFFRNQLIPWHQWDCDVLAKLSRLRSLGHPICVGVSRKSFIGAIAGADDPQQRLPGSLAATASAVMAGAHLIRAHDVEETVQAVRVAEAIRRAVGDA
jgi:dihydropteroate synthase